MKNRYAGICHTCSVSVPVGAGEYEAGYLVCSDLIWKTDAPDALRETFSKWGFSCLAELNRKARTAFSDRSAVREAQREEQTANAPTPAQIAENRARSAELAKQDRAQRRAELAQLKRANICPRCHGEGGSEAWRATGWTCSRCHGTGKYA